MPAATQAHTSVVPSQTARDRYLSVACSRCGAASGALCKEGKSEITRFHIERLQTAVHAITARPELGQRADPGDDHTHEAEAMAQRIAADKELYAEQEEGIRVVITTKSQIPLVLQKVWELTLDAGDDFHLEISGTFKGGA